MPENPSTLQADIMTGIDSGAIFDLKLDTFSRMNDVMNRPEVSYTPESRFANLETAPVKYEFPQGFTYEDAILSNDPKIKELGIEYFNRIRKTDPYFSLGLAEEVSVPYDYAKKYIGKKYGYDAFIPDIEDYYYDRTWGDYSFMGKAWRAPLKFLGRVLVPAVLKLGEGLGYVGSMLTSIGSENYWADVADNGFSHWLEGLEQDYKDQVLPVYKNAGFDEKGFFSKLLDASFWTDEIADGVAFLGSAAIPGMALSKLGKVGAVVSEVGQAGKGTISAANWFGKSFSATNTFGKFLSKAGLGSPAELTSWAFNTAMESAVEGAGVFKENVKKMQELRRRGVAGYADLSDDEIRIRAGELAANTIGGNMAVLSISNAWENKLFFKKAKIAAGSPRYEKASEYLNLEKNLSVTSEAITNLGKKNPFLSELSKTRFYTGKAAKGFLAEGLWEENAQLVIQRMNSIDDNGNIVYDDSGILGFAKNLFRQTGRAFAGKDKEAAESIGLGALIGIGAGVGFSKLANERKGLITDIKSAIAVADIARGKMFNTNDIWKTDDDGNIVYENNKPVVDQVKLEAKTKALGEIFRNIKLSNSEEFFKSKEADWASLTSLGNYVRSLQSIGITNLGERIRGLSGDTAAMFGIDPAAPSEKAGKFAKFADAFEKLSTKANDLKHNAIPNVTPIAQHINSMHARQKVFEADVANTILSDMRDEAEGRLVESLNKGRTLSNSSISQFPAEQMNRLLFMRDKNREVIDSPEFKDRPEAQQQIHLEREKQLDAEIEEFKKNNDLSQTKVKSNGYYVAIGNDGNAIEMTKEESMLLSQIASYTNAMDANSFISSKLSDKDKWFDWLSKLFLTNKQKEAEAAITAASDKLQKSPFFKYKEKKEGDYAKVIRLVGRMLAGEKFTEAEDLALEQEYADLILELLPEYEKSLEENREKIIQDKINTIQKLRDGIYKKIEEKKKQIDELANSVSKNEKLNTKKFQKLIYDTQKTIYEIRDEIDALEEQANQYSGDISELEDMLKTGDIPSMRAALNDLKEHKTWLEIEIDDAKGALARITKLIKDLIKLAKKLIPGFSMAKLEKMFEPSENYYAEGNVREYEGTDTLSSYNEIRLKEDEKKELEKSIKELEKEYSLVEDAVKRLDSLAQDIAKATLNDIQKKYADLVKKKVVKKSFSQEEISANEALAPLVPKVSSIKSKPPKEEDEEFDDTFVRPLTTKFFTSTFTNVQEDGKFSPVEYAHFELLDLLTNNLRAEEAKKKIGKGKLYVVAVTKDNVDKLGLKSVLYNKKEADGTTTDQTSYYENPDPLQATIALVHILEDGGKKYYIDKDLNKIGEVSDVNQDKSKIVYTLLRAGEFKDWEINEYQNMRTFIGKDGSFDEKKWNIARDKALKASADIRNTIFQKAKNFDVNNPNTVFPFNITKGIENRAYSQDGNVLQNPVTSSIMTEDEINPWSMVITTEKSGGTVTINNEQITLPVGRPFIKTKGVTEKLHYANNNKLDDTTVDVVMRVLHEVSKSYISWFTEAMSGSLKGRNFDDLTQSEKLKLLKQYNQKAVKEGRKILPKDYLEYLNSVINFGIVRAGEEVSPNMVYISGSKIYFGDDYLDITKPEEFLTSSDLRDFLKNTYHNVKYIKDTTNSAQQFTEYYLDGEQLKSRRWKFYNQYLLSSKFPDGKQRSYIPVTTSIKTKEQLSVENGPYPPIPYKSQSVILRVGIVQGVSKPTKTSTKVESRGKEDSRGVRTETDKKKSSGDSFLASLKLNKKEIEDIEEEVDEEVEEQVKKEKKKEERKKKYNNSGDAFLASLGQTKEESENDELQNEADEIEEEDGKIIGPSSETDGFGEEDLFRISKGGIFKTEEDLDSIIDYVAKVIPQFPVQRLKQAIQTMDGREALGQFTGNMIKIWEGAEEGTLYHEVFEAVANRLLKDYEWRAIESEFKRRKGTFIDRETGTTLKYSSATPQQIKEQLAEEFREFKLTGKLPTVEKNSRTFLQMIMDFIKKYILNRPTIDDIFNKINAGKFKNRRVRGRSRFASNYRIKFPIEESRYFSFIHGFTGFMFQDLFQSGGESLIQIDDRGEMDSIVYERVKSKIDVFYNSRLSKLEQAYPVNTTDKLRNEENKIKQELFKRSIEEWGKIKEDWTNFVKNHKMYLRKFGVKFDKEFNLEDIDDTLSDNERENKNKNDYTGNDFKINQKNNASSSTRLLVATLIKAKMSNIKFETSGIIDPSWKPQHNDVFLYELMNYDRMMTLIVDKLAGLNKMTLVKEKLREVSGIKDLENATENEQLAIINSLDTENAAFTLLYTRLFQTNPNISEETQLNLRIKFLNYVNKQNPTPWIYTMFQGAPELILSTKRGMIESFFNRINFSIRRNSRNVFIKKKLGNNVYHVSRIGNLRFVIEKLQTFKADFNTLEVENNQVTFLYPNNATASLLKDKLSEYGKVTTKKSKDNITFTVKINPREEDRITNEDFIQSTPGKVSKMHKLLDFLGLAEKAVTPELLRELYTNNTLQYERLVKVLFSIRTALENNMFAGEITIRNANIFGYIGELISILDEINPQTDKQMSHLNGENQMVQDYIPPSFISRIFSEMNNSTTREELESQFPHLKHPFAEDSIVVDRLFQHGPIKSSVSMGYFEGIRNQDGKFIKASRLEEHQRLAISFLLSLEGKYVSLPADSETEWIFNFGEFVSTDMLRDTEYIETIYIPKLKSEISSALAFDRYKDLVNLNIKDNGRERGKSLRFFRNILSNSTVDKINKAIDNNVDAEKIILANREAIVKDINNYIEKLTYSSFDNLLENRVIVEQLDENDNVTYSINFPNKLAEKFGTSFTKSQVLDLVKYQTVNFQIGMIEQFKLFFGDVAQYKDWTKRAKGLFSPIEQTFYDDTAIYDEDGNEIFEGEVNSWFNQNKNSVTYEDASGKLSIALDIEDMFYTKFKNSLTAHTIDDFVTTNPELVNLLNSIGSKFASKFEETNETDGQSIGTLMAIRHLMMKSGWRWTKQNEEFFQYDMALARQELSKPENGSRYDYKGNTALENLDKKILEKYKNNPPSNGVSPIKTSMPSVLEDGTISIVKHSIYPISYQLAKDSKMLDLYIDMLSGEKYDILNFASTQKVGLRTDSQGNITSYYQRDNGNVNPFRTTNIKEVGKSYEISLRTAGIQTETQSDSKTVTFGTQMAKDILINLMPNGIPNDFREENKVLNEQELFDLWSSLSPEERDQQEDYRKVKSYIKSLEDLKEKTVIDKLSQLGVSLNVDGNGKITYYPRDINKLKDFILDEMTRLEIDTNTIEGMQLSKDLEYFKNPSETLPSYEAISNIIWSAADKSINHMKINGGAFIQVSSAFFNKEDRKAAYKDNNGKWITVDAEEDYNKAVGEGKKLVLTSSELKFYSLTEDGKTVNAMEVYLPDFFKRKVNDKRISKGMKPLSDEKLMKYLNENPKLLEGMGFRIPTQAKSSMEFFVIKGFLPESFGKSIVVPSDITTKAGSDFDVDKLNVYLNNWKVNSKGYPEYIEYDNDTSEAATKKRFEQFVRENANRDDLNYLLTLSRYSKNRDEIKDRLRVTKDGIIQAIYNQYNVAIERNKQIYLDMIKDIKGALGNNASVEDEMKELFSQGKQLFWRLPKETVDIFLDLKATMEINAKNGPIEIFEYKKLAEIILSESQNPFEKFMLTQMIEIYDAELKLLNWKEEIGKQHIELAKKHLKDNNITVEEYYRSKKEDALQNSDILDDIEQELFDYDLSIYEDVANMSNIIPYQEFSRLPLSLQNSQKALQNKYFEVSRDILSSGSMFEQLLSPNNMDNIKSGKDAVFQALGKDKEVETFDKFLDVGYIVKKRQAFAKGKYDIGIFAIGMTNYANSQVAGIGIGETITNRADYQEVMKFNNNDITLPFEEVTMLDINGSKFIPLGNSKNMDEEYIMDLISGYITGAVDVAKEPVIVEMGMHTELASSYILLTRAGVLQRKLALFMYQPAIREYLKELIFLKNQEFSTSPYPSITAMRRGILASYKPDKFEYKNIKLSEETLTDMIKKGEMVKRGEYEWTEQDKYIQYISLINFLKVKMFSDDLSKNYRASSHDTAKIRSIWSIVHKDLIYEELLEGNSIVSVKDGEVKDGISAFREDTFIDKTVNLFLTFNEVFSGINLFSLQQENPRLTLIDIAKRIYNDNKFMSQDDFLQQMKEYQAGIVDVMLNKYITDRLGYTPTKYLEKFHKEDGPDNILAQFENVKQILSGSKNFILENLEIIDDLDLGVNVLSVRNKITTNDTFTKELFTSSWRALLSHENEAVRKFAETLVYSSIIQFGVKMQRLNLTPLIPIERYFEITMPALAKLPEHDFTTFEESIIRQNAHKEGFVKDYVPRFGMEFLSSDGKTKSSPYQDNKDMAHIPIDKRLYIRKLSDKELEKGEKEFYNRPIFAYMGYEDDDGTIPEPPRYIGITMVKPFTIDSDGNIIKFIQREFDETDNSEYYKLTKEVANRKKKKDYKSWKYTQVYKLVGADGNTPAIYKRRTTKSGNNKGRVTISYLYKPVNLFGSTGINEVPQLNKNSAGDVIAYKSALNTHIPITETSDLKIYELSMGMKNIGYKDMTPPVDRRSVEILSEPIQSVEMDFNKIKTLAISTDLSIKIVNKEKTSLITSEKVAKGIGIPVNSTELRVIGGNIYSITNRGMMSIAQAGGLREVLKTEGLTAEQMSKSKLMDSWIKGQINLNVFKIEPLTIAPPDLPPIEPEC